MTFPVSRHFVKVSGKYIRTIVSLLLEVTLLTKNKTFHIYETEAYPVMK